MLRKMIYSATNLAIALVVALMLPVVSLTITEHNPLPIATIGVLLPLGFYTIFAALSSRSGRMVWVGFPFIFFSAFQLVLLYLFGNSVIAADMFLNLGTTNTNEAGELLGNIYPAVIVVCIIYIPIAIIAIRHMRLDIRLDSTIRKKMFTIGSSTIAFGCVILFISGSHYDIKQILSDEVFPINASYNMGIAISENRKNNRFDHSSEGFTHNATRKTSPEKREIYVLVIGEASRAANWQLYGYGKETNPMLSQRNDITLFSSITTLNNTTHKSVPMILSSVHPSQHEQIYNRSGLPALFNEAGFTTYFISNQAPQGAMIDNLARDAHHIEYLDTAQDDYQLVQAIEQAIRDDSSQRMLFIIHSYGSHFSYHQRYPRAFAKFRPDDDVAISHKNKELIVNAYDNSILYTDYILSKIIATLEAEEDACCAMLYCSDHGEDLFDTKQKRFLHSSPTTTYHQLHVASLAWFSPIYKELYGNKVAAARLNEEAPATTYSIFHTLADMADIISPYIDIEASLVNHRFDYSAKRIYLNDHNKAIPLNEEIGIDEEQVSFFRRAGVDL